MVYTAQKHISLNAELGDVTQLFINNEKGDYCLTYRLEEGVEKPNGITALTSSNTNYHWRLCHNGTADLCAFYSKDNAACIDDAIDALINDNTIYCISTSGDVNFTRRHSFNKSNITLNFNGFRVTASGIIAAQHNNPFEAIFHFSGYCEDNKIKYTLCEKLSELYDIIKVPSAKLLPLYSWWRLSVNSLSGREEREIDKLVCITEHVSEDSVRINYKTGWPLEIGRELTWQRVYPVENVTIKNMNFYGNEGGEETSAQPISLEYAVRCDVLRVKAFNTYWPVILRRHNTEYLTAQCSLYNPIEVVVGGTGYLTQQIHCLYGAVRDCTASNARHLNDFTSSAYCMAENCHCDGDFHGAFVTHGQFEHDLTYIGNSGLLSFANSGPTWGSSAKRISVIRHVGCWGLGFAKVSDLTLQDVTILKTEKYPECGSLNLNADGLQIRGCSADKLVLTQKSRRSERPVLIEGCSFKNGIAIVREGENAVCSETEIYIQNNSKEKAL